MHRCCGAAGKSFGLAAFERAFTVLQVALANRVEKLLASPKPTSRAMALMLWSVSTSSSFAWVMRKLIR